MVRRRHEDGLDYGFVYQPKNIHLIAIGCFTISDYAEIIGYHILLFANGNRLEWHEEGPSEN
jgi:hypothetical protein